MSQARRRGRVTAAAVVLASVAGVGVAAAVIPWPCAQHEECWYDDANELPPVAEVQSRAQELYPGRYADMWIDRTGPKGLYRVGVVDLTATDRRAWADAWAADPRVLLVSRTYSARDLDRYQRVAHRIVDRHLRPRYSLGGSAVTNQLEIDVYPLPSQAAEADAVRRELAAALPADAYTLTVGDGTPSRTVGAASWYLLGENDRKLTVAVPTGGCTEFDHLEVSERDSAVWLGAFTVSTATPGMGCNLALSCRRAEIDLDAPLGTRRLLHASVPKEQRQPGWGPDQRGTPPPSGSGSC